MKPFVTALLAVVLFAGVACLTACKTDEAGVKSSKFSQYGNVNGDTKAATDAAKAVLEELGLLKVTGTSTGVDGEVIGYKADDTKITIDINRVTDDTSKVSVRVGTLGDSALGTDIVAKIKAKLEK